MKTNQTGAQPANPDHGDQVKKDFKGLLGSVKQFLENTLDIRSNTDQDAARDAIVADISFKGHTAWILICSIFIASIGLNANSTAVVIGAMLISPLMGPILGIGMSLAINDIDTLRRSLNNFAIMVGLSVLTAYLFFKFFPLQVESNELLARTAPDIRDVLIAFFGGTALVIARTKRGTIASVIFGVAIATALMPPLCTVGFGLAIGNLGYAGGALYLFIINTIFIALATFVVLKILRFPMVRYANSKKRRLIARGASLLAVLIMVPAGYTFYQVFQESLFRRQVQELINQTIAVYQFETNGRFMPNLSTIKYNRDGVSQLEWVCMGDDPVPESVVQTWRMQKNQFSKLQNTELRVLSGTTDSEEKFRYVSELYETKKAELLNREERIRMLEEELNRMSSFAASQIPFEDIAAEARANYPNLKGLDYAYTLQTNFEYTDTIPVIRPLWKDEITESNRREDLERFNAWIQVRIKNIKVQVQSGM
ncbi:MAG: hypothetical protein RLZZ241_549 [Bacteroidota bacterium]|jgi:uncharacterized hydrophobic protein (TIGR00271 family)